jgi:hypothetical protein
MIDALVAELNALGYQPAWLPQTGLVPADVYELVRRGTVRLARRGPLHHFLPAARHLEVIRGRSADIEHHQSTKKRMTAAASFLKRALGYLGVPSVPKLDLRFTGGDALSVAFGDVTYQRIDPAAIDPILQELETFAIPEDQVGSGRVHIAYEYLYAASIRVSRADHQAFETNVDGKIGEFIDVGGGVQLDVERSTILSFAARGRPAAFAYKAGCLRRNAARWELSLDTAVRGGAVEAGPTAPFLPALGVVLEADEN